MGRAARPRRTSTWVGGSISTISGKAPTSAEIGTRSSCGKAPANWTNGVARAFERVEGPFVVEIRRRAQPIRTFALYRGYGFRGFAPPPGVPTY